MTSTPLVGTKVRALTTTPTAQRVVVEVSRVDSELTTCAYGTGWYVYGYRQHRGSRPRQTMYPKMYFVPVSA